MVDKELAEPNYIKNEETITLTAVSDTLQGLLHKLAESAGKFNELTEKIYEEGKKEGLNDLFCTLLMRLAVKGKMSDRYISKLLPYKEELY
jgi:transcriptional regulator